MSNYEGSGRGTSWDRIVTHPGFRIGFAAQRRGETFEPFTAKHGQEWWWWYEFGRLFAAAPHSARWRKMPTERRDVSIALRRACRFAHQEGVFPRHRDWYGA